MSSATTPSTIFSIRKDSERWDISANATDTSSALQRPSATPPLSVLWATPNALTATGKPSSSAAATAACASRTTVDGGTGTPHLLRRALESASFRMLACAPFALFSHSSNGGLEGRLHAAPTSTAAWTPARPASIPASGTTPSWINRAATGSEMVSEKVDSTAPLVPVS